MEGAACTFAGQPEGDQNAHTSLFQLCIDANGAWNPEGCMEMLEVLVPLSSHIYMVEQPFPTTLLKVRYVARLRTLVISHSLSCPGAERIQHTGVEGSQSRL
jgi:hypothetical protein